MTRASRSAGLLVVCGMVAAACGSGNPAGPSGVSCRTAATEFTMQTAAPGFTATIVSSCSFSTSTRQGSCTQRYSDSTGASMTITTQSFYDSVADFVDEVKVIPPLLYATRSTGTQTGGAGGPTSGSQTNTFNSSKQITQSVNVSGTATTNTTTYTAWDTAGRPTAARDVGPGFNNTRVITYDDSARTRTNVVNGGVLQTVETFDANGNQIRAVTSAAGSSSTTTNTFSITATQQVCK